MLFAIVGTEPSPIRFVFAMVGCVILAAYLCVYAARCYLVVVQGTTAGHDRVEWSDEPIVDWLWQALYLGALLLIWLAPAGILARALGPDVISDEGGLRFLLIAVPGVWLLFPLGLLSTLTTPSGRLSLARVIGNLLLLLPSVFLFYLLTGGLLVGAAALGYAGLFTEVWYALFGLAIAGSAVLLIHARLVGRLAWLMTQQECKPASRKKPKAVRPPRAVASSDPWAAPEPKKAHHPEKPALGYRVVEREEVEPRPPRAHYLDPEPEPYTFATAEPEPAAVAPAERLNLEQAQVEREVQLRRRAAPNPPPALPMFSGVFTFPAYGSCLKAWWWLALSILVTGFFFRLMLIWWPGGPGPGPK